MFQDVILALLLLGFFVLGYFVVDRFVRFLEKQYRSNR